MLYIWDVRQGNTPFSLIEAHSAESEDPLNSLKLRVGMTAFFSDNLFHLNVRRNMKEKICPCFCFITTLNIIDYNLITNTVA